MLSFLAKPEGVFERRLVHQGAFEGAPRHEKPRAQGAGSGTSSCYGCVSVSRNFGAGG